MPQMIGPLIAAVKVFAATTIGSMVMRVGASLLLSAASSALMARKSGTEQGFQVTTTQVGATVSQAFILGLFATGGSREYHNAHGKDGKTPNAYYTQVISLSDVPGVALDRMQVGDAWSEIDWDHPDANFGAPLLEFRDGSEDFAWVRFHDGNQTTADAFLLAQFAADAQEPWSANHILTGVAYAVVTLRLNRDRWPGVPALRFELSGVPVYDPRADTSVGGDGEHRWDIPATWEPSRNPIVLAYNVLRGLPLPGGHVFGGRRIVAGDLPLANWAAAMNVCDVPVTDGAGTRPQFEAGLEVRTAETDPASVVEALLFSCLGRIAEFGGVFRVRCGAPGVAVAAITDADFATDQVRTYAPFPGLSARCNAVRLTYPSRADGWEPQPTDPDYSATWEAEDGGDRLVKTMQAGAIWHGGQAAEVAAALAADNRRFRTHAGALPPDLSRLELLDSLAFSSDRYGYETKLFEITGFAVTQATLRVAIAMREVDPADYTGIGADDRPVIASPDPAPARQFEAGEVTLAPASVGDDAGTPRRPALAIAWPADVVEDVATVAWRVEVEATGDPVAQGVARADSGGVLISEGIVSLTEYRASAAPVTARAPVWSAWDTATTTDLRFGEDDISTLPFTIMTGDLQSDNYAESAGVPTAGFKLARDTGVIKGVEFISRSGLEDFATYDLLSETESEFPFGDYDGTSWTDALTLEFGPVLLGEPWQVTASVEQSNAALLKVNPDPPPTYFSYYEMVYSRVMRQTKKLSGDSWGTAREVALQDSSTFSDGIWRALTFSEGFSGVYYAVKYIMQVKHLASLPGEPYSGATRHRDLQINVDRKRK